MTRKPIIAANWKMYKTHTDAIQYAQKLNYVVDEKQYQRSEIVLCAPFTDLRTLQTLFDADHMFLRLGAQDTYWEDSGAYTGEVSPVMLRALDVDNVIIGHSERRQYFHESDSDVHKKLLAVLTHGMGPILCIGESEEIRIGGAQAAQEFVVRQLLAATVGLSADQAQRITVAYEPIWAIGTGEHATPEDAQSMAASIRSALEARFGSDAAEGVRIQYGGSVTSGNIESFMNKKDIDGALVGGASLDPQEFARIVSSW